MLDGHLVQFFSKVMTAKVINGARDLLKQTHVSRSLWRLDL